MRTIGCPTRYRTRHFFNFTTNEDIATKFEADLTHCVRNVTSKHVLEVATVLLLLNYYYLLKKCGFGSEWDTLYFHVQ